MTDIGSGFLQAIEAFLNTRLGTLASSAFKDTKSLLGSIVDFDVDASKAKIETLKSDVEAGKAEVEPIVKKIETQTKLIGRMVSESVDDLGDDDFNVDVAARVAVRLGRTLSAMDEAFNIVATELSREVKPDGTKGEPVEATRVALMGIWNPWAQPFKNLGGDAGNLLNQFGALLGIDDLVGELGDILKLETTPVFQLTAKVAKTGKVSLGGLTLDQISVEGFLQFSDRLVTNPPEERKPDLNQRGEQWFEPDVAILGIRTKATLEPGITSDPLLSKIMPGSEEPKTTTPTTVSLDTADGFYLGGTPGNDKAVLPTHFSFPGVELREVAFGLLRNPEREVTGFELTTSIAAKIGDVVGLQVAGAGFVVTLDGEVSQQAVFDLPVSPRWPDQVGLRVSAGPVTGGGFIQRVERTYKVDGVDVKRIEFGGVIQLQILKFGVSAIVILGPDPFSLVMVIGIRFPVAIDLGLGFSLNGIGGILAINRGLDLEALRDGMKEHVLDKMLFPDNPIAEAPKLLDKVAHVFPPRNGGFVVGPIVELGWGSQAKFVELKLGVVLALPDPMIVVLGSLRVQAPTKKEPITDIRADVFVAITPEYLLLFASMRDSKIAGIKISGDLGLYIQWSGGGDFELSIGGFHPEYEKLTGAKPKLGAMDRVTIDLSPAKSISFVIKAYFAITAGSVMLGVDGRLKADFAVIEVKAWLTLDMIFIWSPRFAFKISIEVGVEVELLGFSFCSITFRGSLEGTARFKLEGHVKVDVWFLPTFDEDLGPIEWGEQPKAVGPEVDTLAIAQAALSEPDALKVQLPDHAAQLVTLAEVADVSGRIAHPLAALEVSQTQVPLGVRITHVGSSPVKADMVTLGTPVAVGVDQALSAASEVRTSFPPGHFFDLEGEALLARSGFEELVGGMRMAAASVPVPGASRTSEIRYRTWVRDVAEPRGILELQDTKFVKYAGQYAATTNVARANAVTNPYLSLKPTEGTFSVAQKGSSVITDILTGATVLGGLGSLSATEASLISSAATTAGVATVTRSTLKG